METVTGKETNVSNNKNVPNRVNVEAVDRSEIRQYKIRQTKYLYTTRFNNATYSNNRAFCERTKLKGIYNVLTGLPRSVPLQSIVYVLEMNNETHKIMGIGKILNNRRDEIYRVYENDIYNQKHYRVRSRISLENTTDLDENEKALINLLEYHCFYTKGHLKRGQGLTSFPWALLTANAKKGYDILREVEKMFEKRKSI